MGLLELFPARNAEDYVFWIPSTRHGDEARWVVAIVLAHGASLVAADRAQEPLARWAHHASPAAALWRMIRARTSSGSIQFAGASAGRQKPGQATAPSGMTIQAPERDGSGGWPD